MNTFARVSSKVKSLKQKKTHIKKLLSSVFPVTIHMPFKCEDHFVKEHSHYNKSKGGRRRSSSMKGCFIYQGTRIKPVRRHYGLMYPGKRFIFSKPQLIGKLIIDSQSGEKYRLIS